MNTVDDYIKNGGMAGYARRLLEEQLTQATKDKGHIFHVVVEAMQRGEHKRAGELLYGILRALPDGDQLGVVALCFVTLPAIQMAINEAADRIDDEPFQETLPPKIKTWGAMEAQARVDAPDVKLAKKRREEQKSFREDRQKLDDAKHKQWRKWQADKNPEFAMQKKMKQAACLKKEYSIPENVATIAKRLVPLSPSQKR